MKGEIRPSFLSLVGRKRQSCGVVHILFRQGNGSEIMKIGYFFILLTIFAVVLWFYFSVLSKKMDIGYFFILLVTFSAMLWLYISVLNDFMDVFGKDNPYTSRKLRGKVPAPDVMGKPSWVDFIREDEEKYLVTCNRCKTSMLANTFEKAIKYAQRYHEKCKEGLL
jgi:hypothetical protein